MCECVCVLESQCRGKRTSSTGHSPLTPNTFLPFPFLYPSDRCSLCAPGHRRGARPFSSSPLFVVAPGHMPCLYPSPCCPPTRHGDRLFFRSLLPPPPRQSQRRTPTCSAARARPRLPPPLHLLTTMVSAATVGTRAPCAPARRPSQEQVSSGTIIRSTTTALCPRQRLWRGSLLPLPLRTPSPLCLLLPPPL